MSKIAIISQPNHSVVIDLGGCVSFSEAIYHLTSTLQISSQFWEGMDIELNLGNLELAQEEISQILSTATESGLIPQQISTQNLLTRQSLEIHKGTSSIIFNSKTNGTVLNPVPQSPGQVTGGNQASSEKLVTSGGHKITSNETDNQKLAVPAVLYLKQTLRSGQAVSHQGHLVIVGDVNPGAEIMAEGDITVWGTLRGIAHAGVGGNVSAEIRALRLQATQLRIAHAIARAPDRSRPRAPHQTGPETARIINGTIRIIANNPE